MSTGTTTNATADNFGSCWNCRNPATLRGFPMLGYPQSETYGQGYGKLKVEHCRETITIAGKTYTPPAGGCVHCANSGRALHRFWHDRLTDDSWSDNRKHNMPQVDLPFSRCNGTGSTRDLARAKTALDVILADGYSAPETVPRLLTQQFA